MRYNEFIFEARSASLWHGMDIQHAAWNLENNKIEARTPHRYWPDGQRKKENEPGYEDSFWMKGISTTRDKDFALSWKGAVFELDQQKIVNNYKVVPHAWNFHFDPKYGGTHHKKEKEEFIVLDILKKPNPSPTELTEPGNKALKPLDKFLKGVYIDAALVDSYGEDDKNIQIILTHPKFAGAYVKLSFYKNSKNPKEVAAYINDKYL